MKKNIGYYSLRIAIWTFFILITCNLQAQDMESAPADAAEVPKNFEENEEHEEIIYADSSKGFSHNDLLNHIDTRPRNTMFSSSSEVPNGVDPGSDPDAPVDDMLWLFLITGILYSVRKMSYRNSKIPGGQLS